MVGVYAGGDCVSGPSTVIKAIAAGKAAAANIDEYLGCHHPISCDVTIPEPMLNDKSSLWTCQPSGSRGMGKKNKL